ncbi:MAG TPA: hypothetical protein PKL14_09555 [Holophaga sp.]|nr:hypothetical protein [Holophaga sp.]
MKTIPVFRSLAVSPLLLLLAGSMSTPMPAAPRARKAAAPNMLTRVEAEARLFEAYDLRDGLGDGPFDFAQQPWAASVRPADRPSLRWLAAAFAPGVPANPFRKGDKAWAEADSIGALLNSPEGQWPDRVKAQGLKEAGSRLAFWRWGQRRVRAGAFQPELRRAWEDRLLAAARPGELLFGYALRHALCFALAEADEGRLTQIKERWDGASSQTILAFQRAFALLGAPSPRFRVWRLPEMLPVDSTLGEMGQESGGKRVWIAAAPKDGLPELASGTTWLVPTVDGAQPEEQDSLLEPSLSEARILSERLSKAKRSALLAPVSKPFENCALMFFPILVDLGDGGVVRRIQMGDAALAAPANAVPTPDPRPAAQP